MRSFANLAAVTAVVLVAVASGPARSAPAASGNLRLGGTVRGDISASGGETDTVTVDLALGAKVNLKWSPGFNATLEFLSPLGDPIDLGLDPTRSGTVKAWPAPSTGTYQFRIASSDGSQGAYSLTVQPYWDKKVVLTGTGDTTFDLPMPATGTVKGKVTPLPGSSNPSILSLQTPLASELLVNPVIGSPGVAKLKPTFCSDAGVYRFTATAGAGTRQFQASLTRKAPPLPRENVNIANGIDQTSFATSGVATYFSQRCASCHDWARSYAGVRAYAGLSLGRMKTGNMPQGGPRASGQDIAVLSEWIKTGYGK